MDATLRHPTPRIPLFVGWSVGPLPKKYRIVLANAYTMRTSSLMYDAIIMMTIIIICVRCDHDDDDDHHHPHTLRSSS